MPAQRLVDIDGIAEYLGTTVRHVRGLVEREAIPVTRIGRRLRFDLRKIDRWIETNTYEAAS